MAKSKASGSDLPIADQELAEFAIADSDFGFEMKVLRQLRACRFTCSHSGTYRDPVTDKMRQFDIRAHRDSGDSTLALAVECKNLRPNHPLLLSAVPRTVSEAFHDLVLFKQQVVNPLQTVLPVTEYRSIYKPDEMVAKKTDQVGRDRDGKLIGNDEATFDKLNQAVCSCQDLVRRFATKISPPVQRAIVPVLVVPSGLLWQVDYNIDGAITKLPYQVSRTTLFLDIEWPVQGLSASRFLFDLRYRLSHLEVVTLDGLEAAVGLWLGPQGFFPQSRG
jgi:hypothetical protein